jgi:hypothetical protein
MAAIGADNNVVYPVEVVDAPADAAVEVRTVALEAARGTGELA